MPSPILLWFRNDLRLNDNPALYHAAKQKLPIAFIYIVDDTSQWSAGEASCWWLHHSLQALQAALLKKYGAQLFLFKGSALEILRQLTHNFQSNTVYTSHVYEPHCLQQEKMLITELNKQNVALHFYNHSLLADPDKYLNQAKSYFKVFTPFWRQLQKLSIREIYPTPKNILLCQQSIPALKLEELELLPKIAWYPKLAQYWQPGEAHAQQALADFIKHRLADYDIQRDFPGITGTSKISAHLHFGEISPVQIWHAVQHARDDNQRFLSEIAWREFSYHLLFHFPELPNKPFKAAYAKFPWKKDKHALTRWQQGLTGYPIVDAGMRELWETGYMHNRVRMIVASFLVKHLLIPWQQGEAWFWDTLVDADLANNAASWQWVAGSGADAAPYFRIFNPTLQGEKFDPEGKYVKQWVPELRALDPRYIHQPTAAPQAVLAAANVLLGKNYPYPIVDHATAREKALAAYKLIAK